MSQRSSKVLAGRRRVIAFFSLSVAALLLCVILRFAFPSAPLESTSALHDVAKAENPRSQAIGTSSSRQPGNAEAAADRGSIGEEPSDRTYIIRVLNTDGGTIPGAFIRVQSDASSSLSLDPGTGRVASKWPDLLITDDRGETQFATDVDCAACGCSVTVAAADFSLAHQALPAVPPRGSVEVVIRLSRGWTLQGRVLGLSEEETADADLSCVWIPIAHETPRKVANGGEESEFGAVPASSCSSSQGLPVVSLAIASDGSFQYPCCPTDHRARLCLADEYGRFEEEELVVEPGGAHVTMRVRGIAGRRLGRLKIDFGNERSALDYAVLVIPAQGGPIVMAPRPCYAWEQVARRSRQYPFVQISDAQTLLASAERRFGVWILPEGVWTVLVRSVSPAAGDPVRSRTGGQCALLSASIESGRTSVLSPTFASGGAVFGSIRDALSGEKLSGVVVTCRREGVNSTELVRETTGRDGRFLLSSLPDGVYELELTARPTTAGVQYRPSKHRVSVRAGGRADADLMLERDNLGRLVCTVRDAASDRPVGNAQVLVRAPSKDGFPLASLTDSETGSAVIDGIPAGMWDVEIMAPDYRTERKRLSISASQLTQDTTNLYR